MSSGLSRVGVLRLFAAFSLLLGLSFEAAAQCPSGGTTFTGGQAIATLNGADVSGTLTPENVPANPYPSTLTIPNTATGSIATICVTISGLNASSSGSSTQGLAIALVAPNGTRLGIMGSTGGGGVSLTNATLNISDAASTFMPDANSGNTSIAALDWPNSVGPFTYKPSSYAHSFQDTSFPASPTSGAAAFTLTTAQLPNDPVPDPFCGGGCTSDNQGTSSLNSEFQGVSAAGTWSLYVIDSSGFSQDNISFTSWSLTVTLSQTSVSTSTSLSSSLNPSFTAAPNTSVTLTATVTSSSGTPTGTVEFLDGNTTIAGCGAVALTSGTAHCTTQFSTEGIHTLTAQYTATGSFSNSSTPTPLSEYVKNHSTFSNGSYCNTGVITLTGNGNGTGTSPYPSVINVGTDTPALSSSVSTVSVTLKNLSASGGGAGDIHALLVAPDNTHNLDFMAGVGDNTSQSAVTDTWADGGAVPPNNFGGSPLVSTTYEAYSEDTAGTPFGASTSPAPSLPSSIVFASPGGGTNSKNFEEAFNGAPSDGDWKLFIVDDEGAGDNAVMSGGWCIQITQGSGAATSTVVTSSVNPAVSTPVTVTATIRNANTNALVTEGSVTFTENGQPVSGGPTIAVAVNSNGTASFTTSSLTEGDHTITASYTDSSSTFNLSFGTLIQRVDNATPAPTISANNGHPIYSYCNTGAIQIPGATNPTDKGPGFPNPSNIFVAGLPGQTTDVSITLNNFSHLDPAFVTSDLVGPGGAATDNLDFFSGTGGMPGTDIPVTVTLSDHGSAHAPLGNFTAGTFTYLPTSYTSSDTFTSDQAGFYQAPTQSQVRYGGPFGAQTLDGTFIGSSGNSNGTWSLYFNQTAGSAGGSVGGWCMNFTQTLPALTIQKSAVTAGSMSQGQTGFQYQIVVSNSGPGPTGGTVSVTDSPTSGLTLTGLAGSGWTCTAATCTRTDALAAGSSYPAITATVSVAANAASPQGNSAFVSNAGASNSPLQSNNVSTPVLQSTVTTASNTSVPFSSAAQNVTLSATVTSGGTGVNSGTVSFSVAGINGGTSVTSGTVTSGAASATFSVPGGTMSGSYIITATYNPGSAYAGSSDATHSLSVQAAPATVTSVSSTTANGSYGLNSPPIAVVATFSKAVTVAGLPALSLNDGGAATYSSGSGTASLTFTYTIGAGQNTTRLDEVSTSALTLNGGSIVDSTSVAATLTLPAPGATGSLGANTQIAIDTISPTVVSFSLNFGSEAYNLVGAPRTIHLPWTVTAVTVVFSKPIAMATVSSLSGVSVTSLAGLHTTTLTWAISAVTNGTFSTVLAASGVNGITDADGNYLAGGTSFSQNFSVLYGDFNGDGSVTSADMVGVNAATKTAYNELADLNGDGVVNTADVTVAKGQQGATQQ